MWCVGGGRGGVGCVGGGGGGVAGEDRSIYSHLFTYKTKWLNWNGGTDVCMLEALTSVILLQPRPVLFLRVKGA